MARKSKLQIEKELRMKEQSHVLNPHTGRWIRKGGAVHRKLLKRNELAPLAGKRLNKEEITDEVQKRCLELYIENRELFDAGMSKQEIQTVFRRLLSSSMMGGKKKVRKQTKYVLCEPHEVVETEFESSSDEESEDEEPPPPPPEPIPDEDEGEGAQETKGDDIEEIEEEYESEY